VYVGSVYVYGSVGNIWSHQSKILAKDGAAYDNFGSSVTIYDSTVMIGACYDDDKAANAGIRLSTTILCYNIGYTILYIIYILSYQY
jgi:hypothetical protein